MVGDKIDVVFGDESMALYKNGKLAVAATKLSFGDVLEACDIPCNLWSGDIDLYNDPKTFPTLFKEVVLDKDDQELAI